MADEDCGPVPPPPPPPLPEGFEYPVEVVEPPVKRVDLLDSIRKAGGAGRYNLKRAKDRKLAEPKKGMGPPGLMGDLKATLQSRGGLRGGLRAGLGGRGLRPSGRGLRK